MPTKSVRFFSQGANNETMTGGLSQRRGLNLMRRIMRCQNDNVSSSNKAVTVLGYQGNDGCSQGTGPVGIAMQRVEGRCGHSESLLQIVGSKLGQQNRDLQNPVDRQCRFPFTRAASLFCCVSIAH